jgi:hypothetical protein
MSLAELTPAQMRRMCLEKTRFKSRAAASAVVRRATGVRLHPYRCPVCDGWHLSRRNLP